MAKTNFKGIAGVLIFLIAIVGCSGPGTTTPGPSFYRAGLFKADPIPTALRVANEALTEYQPLLIDQGILREYFMTGSKTVTITVPYRDSVLTLDIEQVNVFSDGLVNINTEYWGVNYTPGHFYNGVLRGHPGSLVSLSIFEDNITGLISSPSLGELNIGRVAPMSYIMYNPQDVTDTIRFDCASPDAGYTTPELNKIKAIQGLRRTVEQAPGMAPCVGVDFELTYEAFQQFKTVPAVVDWFTALFTGVKALYKVEGIDIYIKSLYVWTTEDGYSDNANTALGQVKAKREKDPAFVGNFVHLVRVQGNNLSGLAYVGVLCVPQYRFGFSAVLANYATYPAFSWSTEVLTHELGHNMGSPHTQWCGWPGGAIDNCYTTEGGCAPGPAPVNGGTIMSYCHMTSYGIKFSNGFGPLPGAKIRDYYTKASCASCPITAAPGTDILQSVTKPSKQSSNINVQNSYPAEKANDGRRQPEHLANFSSTRAETFPWWEVDLGAVFNVSRVHIVNRHDNTGVSLRLKKYRLMVSKTPLTVPADTLATVYSYPDGTTPYPFKEVVINLTGKQGRYIRVWADNSPGTNYLQLSEVFVYGSPALVECKDSTIQVPYFKDSVIQVCR